MLTITDDTGRQIRRMDVDKTAGLRRSPGTCAAIRRPATQAGGRRGGGGGGRIGGGRGGAPAGTLVTPGTYRATLGRKTGDTVTPIGPSQTFRVVAIPQ